MVFGHAVGLDTLFAWSDGLRERFFSLSELLTNGLIYVTEATRLEPGNVMSVRVTWPLVFTVAMTTDSDSYPSLLGSLNPAERAIRNPTLNELDDLRTLVCRFRLLSSIMPTVDLGVLLPSLSDPKHPMHGLAKVALVAVKPAYGTDLQLLFHQVQTEAPLNELFSRPVPVAYLNAPLASFADSFFIVKLANPQDPALARLRISERRTTRAAASGTTQTSSAEPSPYLVIFVSSKSHVVETGAENVDPEIEKILAGLGGDTDFAWLLLHVTDSPATVYSGLYRTHIVSICAGTTDYEMFAGPMMATVRRRFHRLHARELGLTGTPHRVRFARVHMFFWWCWLHLFCRS